MPVRRLSFTSVPGQRPAGVLRTIAWASAAALAAVLGVALSIVVVAARVVVGALAWGYVAWKTRALRRALPEQGGAHEAWQGPDAGRVIEGEAVSLPDEPR